MRIQGAIAGQLQGIDSLKKIIDRLGVGDIIRARVMDIKQDEILLKLFDGSLFTAKTLSELNLSIGDKVDLVVNNKTDEQIIMETLKDGSFRTILDGKEISLFLKEEGIKPTQKNIELAKNLLRSEIEPDKNNINRLLDALDNLKTAFKSPDLEKITFLMKNNLPVTEKNMHILTDITNETSKLANDIAKIENMVLNIKDENVINSIKNHIDKAIKTLNPEALTLKETGETEKRSADTLKQDNTAIVKENVIKEGVKITKEGAKINLSLPVTDEEIKAGIKAVLSKPLLQGGFDKSSININKLIDGSEGERLISNLKDEVIKVVSENINDKSINKENPKISELIERKPEIIEKAVMTQIRNFEESMSKEYGITLNKNDRSMLKTGLENIIKDMIIKLEENDSGKVLRELFSGNELLPKDDKVIKEFFKELHLEINKGEIAEKLENGNLIKDIISKAGILRKAVDAQIFEGKEELLAMLDGLEDNFRFLNDVNRNQTLFHIPIVYDENKGQADVYIMQRKGAKKKINPEDVTIYMSVSTQTFGRVNALIDIYKKGVHLNFTVDDEKTIKIFRKNQKLLYDGLLEKGYKLSGIKFRQKSEEVSFKDIDREVNKIDKQSKYRIDYRL